MKRHTSFLTILSLTSFAACASDDDQTPTTPTSQVEGEMRYKDAATSADGSAREAEAPAAQPALVTVEVRGTGTIGGLDAPQCTVDAASGQFRALFDSTVQIDDGGVYAAGYGEGDARIETLGGCEIPELTVGVITDVVVRAELEANTVNCQGYCEANARATAEAQCQGAQDQVACRGSAEASAMASCNTECTTQREVIVAEASLSASLLGELDVDALRAAAFGDFAADLTFDRME
ncbi:MAG: hypothetical protein K8M05_21360 [Deltaproteobacteria bacterium]|nr:hypothetical protein [Kofleriaceae bacterium]